MIVLPSGFPTFAAISRHLRIQAQVLKPRCPQTLVTRARWRIGLHDDVAPIFSLSSWLPRRRDERPPPFSPPASGPLVCVDLSMPEG